MIESDPMSRRNPQDPPPERRILDAIGDARSLAAGTTTAEALVQTCLNRIDAREGEVGAWTHVARDSALATARAIDRRGAGASKQAIPGAESTDGSVSPTGITLAVKDVIDVAGLPSGMGSPLHDGHVAFSDAACVAAARAAGMIVLGKTVTAEFAGVSPRGTRHPANLGHTPGGSSSGSAAAVADGMVHAAIGTQTGGSILRPAAFCGVTGLKPSFGSISRQGLFLAAESFDTIGVIAKRVADCALVWSALAAEAAVPPDPDTAPPRIALFHGPHWPTASAETRDALARTADLCRARGATVMPLDMPEGFDRITAARSLVNDYERARGMRWEYETAPDAISPRFIEIVRHGLALTAEDWHAARRVLERWRAWLDAQFDGFDAILTPTVDGTAPAGIASTGKPGFQEIWTALHVPTLSLPLRRPAGALPLAVQLVGARGADRALLDNAAWLESLAP